MEQPHERNNQDDFDPGRIGRQLRRKEGAGDELQQQPRSQADPQDQRFIRLQPV
ncbi:hypothetical protein D3C87_2059820 [compost metagenome]